MAEIWQIGTGDYGRHYFDLFRKYDLMFMGPGDPGAYPDDRYSELVRADKVTKSKVKQIQAFVNSPKPGDIVLAREGLRVVGIGVIPDEGYEWRREFDDIYGWDLQHTRRVVWQSQLDAELDNIQRADLLFGQRKQIPTFTAVADPKVLKVLDPNGDLPSRCAMRDLKQIDPQIPEPLDMKTLGEKLFSKGLPFDAAERTKDTLQRLRQLGLWYNDNGRATGRPTEHEVVAHMLIPLLKTLGWSVQNLAVEWNKIDLAGFSGVRSGPGNCVFVCEAKGLWYGLQKAFDQAKKYVDKIPHDGVTKILTTDGLRLYIYEKGRGEEEWRPEPTGYLNIFRFREKHICPENTSAVDTIMALTPDGMMRPVGK